MGEDRLASTRQDAAESPAPTAGFFRSRVSRALNGSLEGARTALRRPGLAEIALRGYRRERINELTFTLGTALMEGGFIGVVADKIFHVHPAVLALISAAPMFGNLSSIVWARVAQGRRKVPLITALQIAMVACIACVALLPETGVGSWLLVASLITCRLLLGGLITVRSLVWTLNYPDEVRARVTARLSLLATLTLTVTSLAGGFLLDADPANFRFVYAAGAALSVVGVIAFSGVRLIGEQGHLALERGAAADETEGMRRNGDRGPSAWRLLRADPLYARYQTWQFMLGVSNMMVEAPLIYLVSNQLQASYAVSISITLAIPLALSIATLQLWAHYIDRVHIAEFRAYHSWLWVIAQLLTWLGAIEGSLLLLGVARAVLGIARGGGGLAWQIGHNHFASRETVALYMGIHVTLTGCGAPSHRSWGCCSSSAGRRTRCPASAGRSPPMRGSAATSCCCPAH